MKKMIFGASLFSFFEKSNKSSSSLIMEVCTKWRINSFIRYLELNVILNSID